MTAIACLRIVVGDELMFADQDTMAELVAKVASSYLDSRWLWPRRFGLVAPFAFVLADPRVTLLDPRELQALASELHIKLFGKESEGDVDLLTLEGDQGEVMKFAGASRSELKALLAGNVEGMTSRVCRITRHGVSSVAPVDGSIIGVPPYEQLDPGVAPPERAMFRGIYGLQKQAFIGNALTWSTGDSAQPACEPMRPEGAQVEYDLACIKAVEYAITVARSGKLFLPVSFSTLVKPSSRAELISALRAMPEGQRQRLSASVYDTPRSPTFHAMTQVRTALDPFVSSIDLRVVDPAFQIDYLAMGMATSVTLELPAATEKTRLAIIARFLGEAGAYGRKKVLQGVTDVHTRRELEACSVLNVPFVCGAGVSDLMDTPVDTGPVPLISLPLRNWQNAA